MSAIASAAAHRALGRTGPAQGSCVARARTASKSSIAGRPSIVCDAVSETR